MIKSCKKPPVYFESTTGSFYSQYAGLPLKSCRVDLPVNQSGSGIPSPTNIRDFIPYTALDFTANGTVKTFTFGQNVYIGYLDILTGELVATHKVKVFDGSEVFTSQSNNRVYTAISDSFIPETTDINTVICSHYEGVAQADSGDMKVWKNIQNTSVTFRDSVNATSSTDFKNYLTAQYQATTPVTLAYRLATPITIPLGGMEINTILGLNSLSSSVGNISAEYLKAGR